MSATTRSPFSVIVAATTSGGIGKDGSLPWRLSKDMQYFKAVTTRSPEGKRNAVIMGRKTWESIPAKFRPLPDRINVVITRNANFAAEAGLTEDVLTANGFEGALEKLNSPEVAKELGEVFVIGGGSIYEIALRSDSCSKIYMTTVQQDFECDTFMPSLAAHGFVKTEKEVESHTDEKSGVKYTMDIFRPKHAEPAVNPKASLAGLAAPRHEEYQYLDLIQNILANGVTRGDRTGTGTRSIFGAQMRFSLRSEVFPLLTTKRVFWRGVAEELLWFLSGSTNAKELQEKNIKIWDGNASREYLDKIGLTDREEGDLGPVYGFQWRHFGAEYGTMHDDYTGKGVDQLAQVIKTIKENPTDRRIIMSAWNPAALPKMALPPCHMFCQFYVANGEVSCQMYQRSADMGLGVPFNIASYALLTRLVAQVCGLKAGDFIHTIGDAHVYTNHIEPLQEQLMREPKTLPTLKINPEVMDIDSFTYADLELVGYEPHKTIKMQMSV